MMSVEEMRWAEGLIPIIGPDAVTDIISSVSDMALVISTSGHIMQVMSNPNFSACKAVMAWDNSQIHDTLTVESVPKFDMRLKSFIEGDGSKLPTELNHQSTEYYSELPMRYTFHSTGQSGSVLMLGTDLSTVADMQQQLIAAQIALENDYEVQREHDVRFRVLLEASSTATVIVSVKTGTIVACNAATEKLFGERRDTLVDSVFARVFDELGEVDILDRLVFAATERSTLPVVGELVHRNRRLALSPILFRGAESQMLLCKIKTLGKSDTTADQMVARLLEFYQHGVDGMVFVDSTGNIISANDSFPRLADVTHIPSIKGRSLAEFFLRGSIDLNVMLENARRTGCMRLYATKLVSEHGTERPVEISTTKLNSDGKFIYGLVIRDSRRVDNSRTPTKKIRDVDTQSVIELIGGQSLKDIVSKTTDVVEQICIESAVEMTGNNRVAAAEMLGLSRQSLYVKLHKFGLISKT